MQISGKQQDLFVGLVNSNFGLAHGGRSPGLKAKSDARTKPT